MYMKASEIREIVRMTIEELITISPISFNYQLIKDIVERELKEFFNGGKNHYVGKILNNLYDDDYIDIIFLSYRDGKTLEWIAEYYDKDVSTISRQRKRLIVEIYTRLNVQDKSEG